MIPVKVQCGCGQRYSFEVEPVNGRMAYAVACPVCGVDGTEAANGIIAQALAAAPPLPAVPRASGTRLHVATFAPHTPAVLAAVPPAPVPSTGPAKAAWYEQIWLALPLALVAVGGAIGGGCGGLAWGLNRIVFKKTRNPVLRYVWTGLISAAAALLWFVLAATLLSRFNKH